MNAATITTILTVLQSLLTKFGAPKIADEVITALVALVPIVISQAKEVLPIVQNIIDTLKSDNVTDEQLEKLDELTDHINEAFNQAYAEYLKNHPDSGDVNG